MLIYYAMLCYVVLRYVMLCYVILCSFILERLTFFYECHFYFPLAFFTCTIWLSFSSLSFLMLFLSHLAFSVVYLFPITLNHVFTPRAIYCLEKMYMLYFKWKKAIAAARKWQHASCFFHRVPLSCRIFNVNVSILSFVHPQTQTLAQSALRRGRKYTLTHTYTCKQN